MKRIILVLAIVGSLLTACGESDEIIYPDSPEMNAPTDDDENDENGTKPPASGN